MLVKSYFDGSNKPDPDRYTNLTLASLSGTPTEWRAFDRLWITNLSKHGALYLHTTDAVALRNHFSGQNGWSRSRVNALLLDCAKILEDTCSIQDGRHISRMGLRPCAIRIELADYLRAQDKLGNDMPVATEIVALQAIGYCNAWWQYRQGHFLDAIFDCNEPYRGHIVDRLSNPTATRNFPLSKRLTCKEASMQQTPAIQAADLIAWSVSHWEAVRNEWHRLVLDLPRDGDHFDYKRLLTMEPAGLLEIRSYKLPPRARMRRKEIQLAAVSSTIED